MNGWSTDLDILFSLIKLVRCFRNNALLTTLMALISPLDLCLANLTVPNVPFSIVLMCSYSLIDILSSFGLVSYNLMNVVLAFRSPALYLPWLARDLNLPTKLPQILWEAAFLDPHLRCPPGLQRPPYMEDIIFSGDFIAIAINSLIGDFVRQWYLLFGLFLLEGGFQLVYLSRWHCSMKDNACVDFWKFIIINKFILLIMNDNYLLPLINFKFIKKYFK